MYIQPTSIFGTSLVPDYSSDPFVEGLQLSPRGTTSINITPGSARAYNSPYVLQYNPFLTPGLPPIVTVDISTTGALGCYPTPLANLALTDFTSFGLYIIGSTSGTGSVLPTFVIATGNDFLLPGYNVWRRIGTVYVNNSTLQIVPFSQSGSGKDREYLLREVIPGAAYGPTTFFTLPLSIGKGPCNPYFTTDVITRRRFTPASVTDYAAISQQSTGATASLSLAMINPVAGEIMQDNCTIPVKLRLTTLFVNEVYITVVGAGALFTVNVCGWKESMGLNGI